VNPLGPRSVYDEAKRFAETLTMAWRRTKAVDTGIVRLFNTYGPRMRTNDGRAVSNFFVQALEGRPLTVYGDGTQTRSLCFVDETVEGIIRFLDSGHPGPMNVGSPEEHTVLDVAHLVLELTGSRSEIAFRPLPQDDPTRRCPDISLAREQLGWSPKITLREGLALTAPWFVGLIADVRARSQET
jgi:nucleoside-diphosphate-sugar epimerase